MLLICCIYRTSEAHQFNLMSSYILREDSVIIILRENDCNIKDELENSAIYELMLLNFYYIKYIEITWKKYLSCIFKLDIKKHHRNLHSKI